MREIEVEHNPHAQGIYQVLPWRVVQPLYSVVILVVMPALIVVMPALIVVMPALIPWLITLPIPVTSSLYLIST